MTEAESLIGYTFSDRQLLTQALTHPSYGGDHHVPHYQRLEFLGDAVLELYVSEQLYKAYPALGEGKLTRMRADLVREETLAYVKALNDAGVDAQVDVYEGWYHAYDIYNPKKDETRKAAEKLLSHFRSALEN